MNGSRPLGTRSDNEYVVCGPEENLKMLGKSYNEKILRVGGVAVLPPVQKRKSTTGKCPKLLSSAGKFIDSYIFLRTPLCFLILTVLVFGIGVNYYKVSPVSWILWTVAGGVATALTIPFFVFKLARFSMYLTFVDSGSKILRILAVSFILTTLTTGPIFRLWTTASTVPDSLECTKKVTSETMGGMLHDFKRSVTDTVVDNLEVWNEKTKPIRQAFDSVANALLTVEKGLQQGKQALNNARDSCAGKMKEARNNCHRDTRAARDNCKRGFGRRKKRFLDSIGNAFKDMGNKVGGTFTDVGNTVGKTFQTAGQTVVDGTLNLGNTIKNGVSEVCQVVDVASKTCDVFVQGDYCQVLVAPIEIVSAKYGLDEGSKKIRNLLDVSIDPSHINTEVSVDAPNVTNSLNNAMAKAEELLADFNLARSIITHITVGLLILRLLLNGYSLVKKLDDENVGTLSKLKQKVGKLISKKASYVQVFIMTFLVTFLYFTDYLLHYCYCNLAEAIGDDAIEVSASSGFKIKVGGGELGKLIASLFVSPVDSSYKASVRLNYQTCFPVCEVQTYNLEAVGCLVALVALCLSVSLNRSSLALKENIIKYYHE